MILWKIHQCAKISWYVSYQLDSSNSTLYMWKAALQSYMYLNCCKGWSTWTIFCWKLTHPPICSNEDKGLGYRMCHIMPQNKITVLQHITSGLTIMLLWNERNSTHNYYFEFFFFFFFVILVIILFGNSRFNPLYIITKWKY